MYQQNHWTGNPDEIGADIADRLLKTAKKVEKFVELSDNSETEDRKQRTEDKKQMTSDI